MNMPKDYSSRSTGRISAARNQPAAIRTAACNSAPFFWVFWPPPTCAVKRFPALSLERQCRNPCARRDASWLSDASSTLAARPG